jgi:hypothetical protein
MNHAPAHIAPLLGFALADDDDVGEQAEPSQSPSQPDRLPRSIVDQRLDHQEVEIAVRASITPRVGAEQDHTCLWSRLRQPAASLGDQSLVEHTTTLLWSEVPSVLSEMAFRGDISRELAERALKRFLDGEIKVDERRPEG